MTTMSHDFNKYPIAMTQTVREQYHLQKVPSPYAQHKEVWSAMESLLRFGKVDYIIWPDLTLTGQIHYHGFIKVNDQLQFHKMVYMMKKRFGYNLFKLIDNVPKWQEYCDAKKQLFSLFKLEGPLVNTIKLEEKPETEQSKNSL